MEASNNPTQRELTRLAKQLISISLEDEKEEYILTSDEEKSVIENAINQKKEHAIWKMKGLAFLDEQIKDKIDSTDWEKEIDREAIFFKANSDKHQDLWHKEQRKLEKERQQRECQELSEKCSAKYMLNLMKWTSRNELGKDFIIHNDNLHLIKTICFFLSNDERFEKDLGYSFQKGLLIRGISGLGKTHLIKCVSKNELKPILVLSMIDIADQVKSEGDYFIQLGENKAIYLDDVGTEEATVNHFGTRINFFKNFIEMYYLRNKIYNKLIISTNNSFAEIEEKYGFRVRSRMKDMFNIVDVKGKDMRG